jgi:hypothetical protein
MRGRLAWRREAQAVDKAGDGPPHRLAGSFGRGAKPSQVFALESLVVLDGLLGFDFLGFRGLVVVEDALEFGAQAAQLTEGLVIADADRGFHDDAAFIGDEDLAVGEWDSGHTARGIRAAVEHGGESGSGDAFAGVAEEPSHVRGALAMRQGGLAGIKGEPPARGFPDQRIRRGRGAERRGNTERGDRGWR